MMHTRIPGFSAHIRGPYLSIRCGRRTTLEQLPSSRSDAYWNSPGIQSFQMSVVEFDHVLFGVHVIRPACQLQAYPWAHWASSPPKFPQTRATLPGCPKPANRLTLPRASKYQSHVRAGTVLGPKCIRQVLRRISCNDRSIA